MRGKVQRPDNGYYRVRITPAYAGKSGTAGRQNMPLKDHPRLCGEKHMTTKSEIGIMGITPAYAGKRRFTILHELGH